VNLKKLMSKRNKVYSFYELPLGIKKVITNYGVWSIGCLFITIVFAVTFQKGQLSSILMLLAVPFGIALLFAWLAYYTYLIGRTGYYLVYEGICVETEKSLNPVKKAKASMWGRMPRFLLETDEGESYRIMCNNVKQLPSEGSRVQIIVSRKTQVLTDELVTVIPNFLCVTSVKKIPKKKQA